MLTNEDLKQLKKLVDTSIKDAFTEFYETIFEPYVNRNEKEHTEIKLQLEEIKEHVIDHENRLQKVEALTSVKN